MSGHGHPTPEEIRASLDHPVIDGDGHWVEFDPVFAERMRKVGGDLAADGFLAAMKTTRNALSMSVAERKISRPPPFHLCAHMTPVEAYHPGVQARKEGNAQWKRGLALSPRMDIAG